MEASPVEGTGGFHVASTGPIRSVADLVQAARAALGIGRAPIERIGW